MNKSKFKWMRVPIVEPLDVRTMWEHTPLDYYRYGEYPRFLRPVDAHQPRWEWKLIQIEDRLAQERLTVS